MKKIDRTLLQIIALITMTIDHAGKVFFRYQSLPYEISFRIGRIAFPLFCLMIAYGARHSRNVWKYLGRILFFGCLIEIGLGLGKLWFNLNITPYFNIFFSLGIGLLTIILLKHPKWYIKLLSIIPLGLFFIANLLIKQIMINGIAFPFQFEYGFYGLFLMLWFAFFDKSIHQVLGLLLATLIFCEGGLVWLLNLPQFGLPMLYQWYGILAVPIILLYNGKKGKWQLPKYFMYFYYPLHMLAIYGLFLLIY